MATEIRSLFAVDVHRASVIDGGLVLTDLESYSLTPNHEYRHPIQSSDRPLRGNIDIGAYEYKLPCDEIYTSYTFDGSYDKDWSNSANWDNDCLPPQVFTGPILINAECEIGQNCSALFKAGIILTIKTGGSLTWKP